MTYLVSDLYGNEGLFERVKKEIGFSKNDYLFLLGNSIDYGEDSISLLVGLSYEMNIWPVAGERELKAREMLGGFESSLSEGKTPDAEFIAKMRAWVADGGEATFSDFRELDAEMKEGVLDYLAEMPTCESVAVGNKNYLLISNERSFDPEELPEELKTDRYVTVVGHPDDPSAGIVITDEKIFLGSCGENGSSVSVLRLDDMKGFLVK
ncbi:MAG: hypothetical protein J6V01_08300 [Clostridia bacterium]|nr:hypothetical protein [Clostridia bacterium]